MSIRNSGRRNQSVSSDNHSPRWWRWPRQSPVGTPVVAPAPATDESWSVKLDRVCRQLAPYLPPISAATRKATLCMVALVVAWKFVIWTLELVVTGACFALAVAILLCFLRPDTALWLATQVLPPFVDDIREWLSQLFMQAGQFMLDRGPPGTSSLPLPAPPSLPPQPPTPRSPRTTLARTPPETLLVPPANA